jgi:NAD(P)-dependent dehydrogenase (short-subunit alcohol dehydrogenase family)
MSVPNILFGFMPKFFYAQLFVTPPVPSKDCTGKTIIVTGANVGLGKEAARHYVRLNAEKVILACRSLDKGEAAKKDIEASTGRKDAIEVWQLDLSSYQSVKQFAERAKTLRRLDSIVENAGISTRNFKEVEGNESTSKPSFGVSSENNVY